MQVPQIVINSRACTVKVAIFVRRNGIPIVGIQKRVSCRESKAFESILRAIENVLEVRPIQDGDDHPRFLASAVWSYWSSEGKLISTFRRAVLSPLIKVVHISQLSEWSSFHRSASHNVFKPTFRNIRKDKVIWLAGSSDSGIIGADEKAIAIDGKD